MTNFLYTAKNRVGQRVTERISANNTSAARYALETRGYTEICFETDELQADIDRLNNAKPLPKEWTPELEMESRRLGGPWSHVLFALKLNAVLWVPLVFWDYNSLLKGAPYGFWSWTGFLLSIAFIIYLVCVVVPGIVFQLILTASAWARWDELRMWVRRMRQIKKFLPVPIPEFDLDMRLGYALASEGKLDEALALASKYENDPTVGKGIYNNRVSSFFLPVGQYQKCVEMRAKSVEQGTGSASELIDYAMVFARDCRDPAGARRVLERVEGMEIASIGVPFLSLCKGIIAVEENEWNVAKGHLVDALRKAKPFEANVAFTGVLSQINAYLAIALANLGERDEAVKHFRAGAAYLIAHKKAELIARCEEATGFKL